MKLFSCKSVLAVLLFFVFVQSIAAGESEVSRSDSIQTLNAISINFDDYAQVDVSLMIERLSRPGDKRRFFIEPDPVRFRATLMQKPKPGYFELVYEALSAWGVDPLPQVEHSSYLKIEGGQVIPVYLEMTVAELIDKEITVQQQAEFYALHIYNYEKGPRFLVVSVNKGSIK